MKINSKQTMKLLFLPAFIGSTITATDAATSSSTQNPDGKLRGGKDIVNNVISKLKNKLNIGFAMPLYPDIIPNDAPDERHLSAGSAAGAPYTFTSCAQPTRADGTTYGCNDVIVRYTAAEVKTLVDNTLSALINVPGCLDGAVASGDLQYGCLSQDNLDAGCGCGTGACILGFCFVSVCPDQCYTQSGIEQR